MKPGDVVYRVHANGSELRVWSARVVAVRKDGMVKLGDRVCAWGYRLLVHAGECAMSRDDAVRSFVRSQCEAVDVAMAILDRARDDLKSAAEFAESVIGKVTP